MKPSNRFWIGSLLLISCTAIAYPSHADAASAKVEAAVKTEPDCQWRRAARHFNPGRIMPARRRCITPAIDTPTAERIAQSETRETAPYPAR